ncbi:MAG: YbaB/EbfC family nucleoid-associated protein [Ghiorsea sp.]|nr:YbaB/EbfC family nucleoid-associated protein [Ghiorsea sp.]
MNIAKMMQQAKKMKDGMAQMQEELANMEVVGESANGLVKVTVSGNHQIKRIEIDDSLMGDDKTMLEDLMVIAVNAGMQQIEEASKAKQKDMMGGVSLPPGFSL